MELKYLKTFKLISETGSFLNAAKQLNYAQSTITFQMQQLEKELSVKLFEKVGRKMAITQTGKEIIPIIDNILKSLEQLENYNKDLSELTGTLKIAMPETLLTYKMQPVLKAFREQAPGVKLSIQTLNCYEISDYVIKGGADMGIHYDVGGIGKSAVIENLADFHLALIASPTLEDKFCDFISADQRSPLCLITNDITSIFHHIFDSYLREKNIVLDGMMELGSIETVKRSVASNLGVAILPKFVAENEIKNGSLKEIETKLHNEKITAVCVHHKNKWVSPAMKLFMELSRELFKN